MKFVLSTVLASTIFACTNAFNVFSAHSYLDNLSGDGTVKKFTAPEPRTPLSLGGYLDDLGAGSDSSTSLRAERGDSTSAIKEAIEASRKYGPSSPEARVAWDIVEEINASDNSAAYKGKEAIILENPAKEEDVLEKLESASVEMVQKEIAEQIRAVKIPVPTKPVELLRWNNPELDSALEEAKNATEKHGISSPEARLAWEAVENIAGNDFSEATKRGLSDEECLVEYIEACEAMEELNRALFSENVQNVEAAEEG